MDIFNTSRDRGVYRWLFRIGAVVVGLTVLVTGVKEFRAATHLQSVGRVALIDPIDSYTRQIRAGTTTYAARITFHTSNGRHVSVVHHIPKEALEQARRGAPVRVIYDPEKPSRFAFESEVGELLPAWIGTGLLVVGLFML